MTVTYCTADDISNRIQGEFAKSIALSSDTGVSQSNKDRIYVADTAPFTAGDNVRVTDDSEKTGEDLEVDSIVADTYLVSTTDMTKDYTTANNAKVRMISMFSNRSHPTKTTVEQFINEAEDHIDDQTHHGWRAKTITDEYHDIKARYVTWTGIPIKLRHRSIRTFDTNEGDKLEIWNGNEWLDWIANKTEGRSNEFWINQSQGMLYIRMWYIPFRLDAIRITYRYGESTIPNDIKRCATLMAAADVLDTENFVARLPDIGDGNIVPVVSKQERWRREAEKIIDEHRELIMM